MRRHQMGFTLIELMIVVIVVAILATVAYPSFVDQMRRAKRSDGKESLLRVQIEQEKWRSNHSAYSGTLGGANCGAVDATGLCLSATSAEGYYAIAVTTSSATGFTATADPQGSQASDSDCDPLVLTVAAGGETRGPAGCW